MTWFPFAVGVVAVIAGATATVVGFGIGSMLTPLLAVRYGTSVAVAAVTIPHAVATALRCWRLRKNIDWSVLGRFGLLSAAGGLAGAIGYTRIGSPALTKVLGGLLVLTATAQLMEWASRWHPRGPTVALLGFSSGFFGGIAGNQGGLRAAALTAFGLAPSGFVATSTAIGLAVDFARTPVYLWSAGGEVVALAPMIAVAVAGVVGGTVIGERILFGLTPAVFRKVVAVAIGLLGAWLLWS